MRLMPWIPLAPFTQGRRRQNKRWNCFGDHLKAFSIINDSGAEFHFLIMNEYFSGWAPLQSAGRVVGAQLGTVSETLLTFIRQPTKWPNEAAKAFPLFLYHPLSSITAKCLKKSAYCLQFPTWSRQTRPEETDGAVATLLQASCLRRWWTGRETWMDRSALGSAP